MSGFVKFPTTLCNIPEDQNPQQQWCGNLISFMFNHCSQAAYW